MDLSEHNLLPFVEIEKAIEKQGYGPATITFEVFQGKIVKVQGEQYQEYRFKEGDNAKAGSLILAEMKDLFDKHHSGMFTSTIQYEKGNIKKVFLQRHLNKSYPVKRDEAL